LIVKNTVFAAMEFSRCARAEPAERDSRLEGGLSQLSSASRTRSTLVPGEPELRTPKHRQSRAPAGVRAPASLERR
jgi:hypothetical protein